MARILELIPIFVDGGAERFVVDISNEFVKQGHEVAIVSLFPRSEQGLSFFPDLNPGIRLYFLNKRPGLDIKVFNRLAEIIRNEKPDLIHTHLRVINYLLIERLFSSNKIPIIHTVHNDASQEVLGTKELRFRKWAFKRLKVEPITISEKSKESFIQYYQVDDVLRIDNGRTNFSYTEAFETVQHEWMRAQAQFGMNVKLWLNIGRITPQKNQVMLVKSFARLIEEGHNGVLWIMGTERPPVSEAILSEMAPYLGDRIQLIGGKTNATDYLLLADYFVLSSLYEGMPISVIEAMAAKTMVVSTPVGGVPEMVAPFGIISKDVEINAFFKAMLKAASLDEMDYKQRTSALHDRFQKQFTMEVCAKEYLKLLQ